MRVALSRRPVRASTRQSQRVTRLAFPGTWMFFHPVPRQIGHSVSDCATGNDAMKTLCLKITLCAHGRGHFSRVRYGLSTRYTQALHCLGFKQWWLAAASPAKRFWGRIFVYFRRKENIMPTDAAPAAGLRGFEINTPPAGLRPEQDLPAGFLEFFLPLHRQFTPLQQELVRRRGEVLQASLAGKKPNHLPPSPATQTDWKIALPEWCQDQRNQM